MGQEISSIDRLLNSLREVYGIVKTKRQLGLEVPAGFRNDTNHSQNYRYATPPRKSESITSIPFASTQHLLDDTPL